MFSLDFKCGHFHSYVVKETVFPKIVFLKRLCFQRCHWETMTIVSFTVLTLDGVVCVCVYVSVCVCVCVEL